MVTIVDKIIKAIKELYIKLSCTLCCRSKCSLQLGHDKNELEISSPIPEHEEETVAVARDIRETSI